VATYDSIITRTETGEGSGTLIPEAQRNEILKGVTATSAVLQLARKVNMSTKHEKQPVLSVLPEAYWVSGDTGLKETSAAEWDNKEIIAEELAVIFPVPENLIADAAYDIFSELRPLIVEALGVKLDQAVLFGTGAPASYEDSVVEAAVAAGNTVNVSATGDDASDVSTLMGLVEADGYNVNGFAGRMRLKARLRNLRDTSGAPIFSPSLTAGTPSTLWGENIVYSDANGAWNAEGVDLIGGDWSKLVVGVRQDITFKLFTEGVSSDGSGNVVLNLMQQDSVALRVTARYGFTVANPINRMNQVEDERYPFAVLETAEGS
jgi:HK97 family phage major capsid protein